MRPDCALCEEFLHALQALPAARHTPIELVDVDRSPEEQVRFGHKIPVLLLDGDLVCHGRLDPDEVRKALAYTGRSV